MDEETHDPKSRADSAEGPDRPDRPPHSDDLKRGQRDVQEHIFLQEGGGGASVGQDVDRVDNVSQIGAPETGSDFERDSTETAVHRPSGGYAENRSLVSLLTRTEQLSAELAARADSEETKRYDAPRNDISENKHDAAWILGHAELDTEPRARTGSGAATRTGTEHANMTRDPTIGNSNRQLRASANLSNIYLSHIAQTSRQSVLPTLTPHSHTHNISQPINAFMSPPPPLEHPTPKLNGANAIDQGGDATDVEGALGRFADTASIDDSDTQSIVSVASSTRSDYIMSGRTVGAHGARTSSVRGYYSMPRGMRNRDADLSEGGGTDVERLQRKRMPSRRQGYPHGERILEGEKYSSERKRLNFMKTETRDLIMSDTNKRDFYRSISFLPDTEFCRRIQRLLDFHKRAPALGPLPSPHGFVHIPPPIPTEVDLHKRVTHDHTNTRSSSAQRHSDTNHDFLPSRGRTRTERTG